MVSVFQITLPGTDEAAQDKCIVTKFTLPACYQRNKKKERETNPSKQIHTHSPITHYFISKRIRIIPLNENTPYLLPYCCIECLT